MSAPSEKNDTRYLDATRARGAITFVIVIVLVLLSRLPFLGAGYGTDPDAWALADAARRIATTGEYVASRLPGYPIPEFVCSLLWKGGPLALNGMTALLSAAASAFFMAVLRRLESKDALPATLAFALTPVVFINSVNSMDYAWALMFILASYYCLLLNRPLAAGLLLGLAVGCRLTSGLMLVSFIVSIYWSRTDQRKHRSALTCVLAACLVSTLAYWPVLHRHGWAFLTFYEMPDYPNLILVLSRASLRIWGFIGLTVITGALLFRIFRRPREDASSIPTTSRPMIVAVLVLLLFGLAYLRLPLEAAYLIPAVPFFIVLLGHILSRRTFRLICWSLCLSPFICYLGRGPSVPWPVYSSYAYYLGTGENSVVLDPFKGSILHDYSDRVYGMKYVDALLSKAESLPPSSVVIVGYWLPQLRVRLADNPSLLRRFVYLPNPEDLNRYRTEGLAIYCLTDMLEYCREVKGFNLLDRRILSLEVSIDG